MLGECYHIFGTWVKFDAIVVLRIRGKLDFESTCRRHSRLGDVHSFSNLCQILNGLAIYSRPERMAYSDYLNHGFSRILISFYLPHNVLP
jgi:hypothetical protein